MFSKKWIKNIVGCALLSLIIPSFASAFDSAKYFDKKCSGCHSIGEGDIVGPDLKGVTERRTEAWIKAFIKDSEAVIKSGDPIAVELFAKYKNKKMPARELSDEDMSALYQFLKAGVAPITFKAADEATPEEVAFGKAIFTGNLKLEGGGNACLSCHNGGDIGVLGGGSFGPDLVATFANGDDQKMHASLLNIVLPTKNQTHNGLQLTTSENFYLRAYLNEAAKTKKQSDDQLRKFALIGIFGAIFIFAIFDYRLKKRSKQS